MAKHTSKKSQNKPLWFIFFALGVVSIMITLLVQGNDIRIFNPKGLISGEQVKLITFSVLLMLTVAIPTIGMLYLFAWRYRETNQKATYNPNTHHGKLFVASIWGVPILFMIMLASMMWPATHRLEPKKSIVSDVKPVRIQVIAMRWKWLFIYPDQHIATVNYVQIPTDTPVQFELTADEAPMSSFWIPHLGGQLYAMTGHINRLNLLADEAGDYPGSSAEINGAGFAGMKFVARATSPTEFDQWVQQTQQNPTVLNMAEYDTLLKPSEDNPPAYYGSFEPDLYDKMLMKYMGSHSHQSEHE